jgi:short-subunit dehydrogenase
MDREVVFITGGTSGIGAAFARHFAREGYDLIITGKPKGKIYPCIEKLSEKYNVNVEIIQAEFSDSNDVAKVEDIIRKNNKIEYLISNAGFGLGKPFWMEDIENLEKMIKVHIIAPVRFIYAAIPNMSLRKKGVIISMSSLASFLPIPHDSLYSATKLFNKSFMESMYISFRDKGIKVQVLCPGFVRTDFHKRPAGDQETLGKKQKVPWMNPDEIVKSSVKNLRKNNRVIIIPGFWNKFIKLIYIISPKPVYYWFANKYLI